MNEKLKLYYLSTFDEIEILMHQVNISITKEDVLQYFNKIKDIDATIEYFQSKYETELDALMDNTIMFDDDCIYLYILKLFDLIEVK